MSLTDSQEYAQSQNILTQPRTNPHCSPHPVTKLVAPPTRHYSEPGAQDHSQTLLTKWSPACWAQGQFRSAVAADDVAALTLRDGGQCVVEAHRTLEETRQIIIRWSRDCKSAQNIIHQSTCHGLCVHVLFVTLFHPILNCLHRLQNVTKVILCCFVVHAGLLTKQSEAGRWLGLLCLAVLRVWSNVKQWF